jgi:hypothetical protein
MWTEWKRVKWFVMQKLGLAKKKNHTIDNTMQGKSWD